MDDSNINKGLISTSDIPMSLKVEPSMRIYGHLTRAANRYSKSRKPNPLNCPPPQKYTVSFLNSML